MRLGLPFWTATRLQSGKPRASRQPTCEPEMHPLPSANHVFRICGAVSFSSPTHCHGRSGNITLGLAEASRITGQVALAVNPARQYLALSPLEIRLLLRLPS